MGQMIRDVMTTNPVTLAATATVIEAAQKMKERDIGDVIVMKDDKQMCGIVTDRDIVVRAIATGRELGKMKLDEVCSRDVTTVAPTDDIEKAIQLMRDKGVRRLPVVENGRPIGIISLGDLAVERDRRSCLGDISAQPPNN
jgi:CBS domain-containing protein